MVRLEFYSDEHFEALNSYQLDEVQMQFTATVFENIIMRKVHQHDQKNPIIIFYSDFPVGFFVLDFSEEVKNYSDKSNTVLLRSLSINPNYQGKGIAKKAMHDLDNFMRFNFSEIQTIVLAVNSLNIHAFELYKKCKFQPTGKIVVGNRGQQYVMEKEI